ncbi:MAG TPA: AAA-like domain-containing protein [Terriglobales bacterium]|nr:AAA-like domain-containing protein [Terriglobales bacterium]
MSAAPEQYFSPHLIHFGEFLADLRTGELWKNGNRIPLQNQPFRVLSLLLERPGELVDRADVRRAICPPGVHLDHDHAINRAVNKLRAALGDNAGDPQIIETLSGRGYRLLTDIKLVPPTGTAAHPISPSTKRLRPNGILPLLCHGALPIDSPFYIERRVDEEVHHRVETEDSVILLKGARQTGKTSLLARVLARARAQSKSVIVTDLQKLRLDQSADINFFLQTIARSVAESLQLEGTVEWDSRRSGVGNFERFIRRVLKMQDHQLVWGIDEADRVFPCSFASEFFGLLRAWHNDRALDPGSAWHHLTIVIAYATEAHLFITDANQSPFNVGSKFELLDFEPDEVRTLNDRYGSPADSNNLDQLQKLVGGHPYLVQRGLYELTTRHCSSPAELATASAQEDGPFAEHLRHMLLSLQRRPELLDSLHAALSGTAAIPIDHFYRLRAFGVLSGDAPRNAVLRCKLYRDYITRHLL